MHFNLCGLAAGRASLRQSDSHHRCQRDCYSSQAGQQAKHRCESGLSDSPDTPSFTWMRTAYRPRRSGPGELPPDCLEARSSGNAVDLCSSSSDDAVRVLAAGLRPV